MIFNKKLTLTTLFC